MPRIRVNGVELHYEEAGVGPQAVVFAHGLMFSGQMYEAQVAALKDRFRCITFDFRGQGQSEVTRAGYDVDTLTDDAAALIRELGAAPCHFVGLSMGTYVAMRLGARQPELVRSLTLMSGTAEPEPREMLLKYRLMAHAARWLPLSLLAKPVEKLMTGPAFRADPASEPVRKLWRDRLVRNSHRGISRAALAVYARPPIEAEVPKITAPTLIVCGSADVVTPPAKSERMHELIPNSRLAVVPGAGHMVNIEQPAAVNAALTAFLDEVSRAG